MEVLKALWDAGLEDSCTRVVAKLLSIPLETAHYRLVLLLDDK